MDECERIKVVIIKEVKQKSKIIFTEYKFFLPDIANIIQICIIHW